MDYVDWVEKVMKATAHAWKRLYTQQQGNSDSRQQKRPDDYCQKYNGVSPVDIAGELGIKDMPDSDTEKFWQTKQGKALLDALSELENLGLIKETQYIDSGENHIQLPKYWGRCYRLTQEGLKFPDASMMLVWKRIFKTHIGNEQYKLLTKLAEVGQETYEDYACVREVQSRELQEALGWNPDDPDSNRVYEAQIQNLKEAGLLTVINNAMTGRIEVTPTYSGLVRVTRQEQSEWQEILAKTLPYGETTNVEFKRQLNLKNDKGKAEFIRDVLALATTKSSDRRLLIIGFDDKKRLFVKSVSDDITRDRLESILNCYTEPTPDIRYHKVPWEDGTVGIIEIIRNPMKIPYRVKKSIGRIKEGQIFVRHGSHTEEPTPDERKALMAEGRRARRFRMSNGGPRITSTATATVIPLEPDE